MVRVKIVMRSGCKMHGGGRKHINFSVIIFTENQGKRELFSVFKRKLSLDEFTSIKEWNNSKRTGESSGVKQI